MLVVDVSGDNFLFFFHGQSDGKLAEKFCHVRVDIYIYKGTIRTSTNREGEKNTLFVNVRVSMPVRTRLERILSQRCPTMILRLEKSYCS